MGGIFVKANAANIIAENILNQIDNEGFTVSQIKAIHDHPTTANALTQEAMYIVNQQGVRRIHKTTVGWHLLVEWEDGTKQWISLAIMKESNPVEVAEYDKACGFDVEPAFAWWVPYTLRKT